MDKLVKKSTGEDTVAWTLYTDEPEKKTCWLCKKNTEKNLAYYCPILRHVYCEECEAISISKDCAAHSIKEMKKKDGHTHYLVRVEVVPEEVLE